MTDEAKDCSGSVASRAASAFFWITAVISAMLLACALSLSIKLWQLPKTNLDGIIGLVKATLFTYGLGLGLFGSSWALTAPISQRRFGTATTVHGSGFLVFALTVRPMLEQQAFGYSVSMAPMVLPMLLWLLSLVMFAQAAVVRKRHLDKEESAQDVNSQQDTMAEPQQPLSQP